MFNKKTHRVAFAKGILLVLFIAVFGSMIAVASTSMNNTITVAPDAIFTEETAVVASRLGPTQVKSIDHRLGPTQVKSIDHRLGPTQVKSIDHRLGPTQVKSIDRNLDLSDVRSIDLRESVRMIDYCKMWL